MLVMRFADVQMQIAMTCAQEFASAFCGGIHISRYFY